MRWLARDEVRGGPKILFGASESSFIFEMFQKEHYCLRPALSSSDRTQGFSIAIARLR
jgi:hypothetical protein